jgi:hypothetical protein
MSTEKKKKRTGRERELGMAIIGLYIRVAEMRRTLTTTTALRDQSVNQGRVGTCGGAEAAYYDQEKEK